MKRLILIAILVAAAGFGLLSAQSLVDNSYYQRSQELRGLADKAFSDGDYDAAADYAAQAQEYASLSDQFVEKMLAMTAADKAIARARAKAASVDADVAKQAWPVDFAAATDALSAAVAAFDNKDYAAAKDRADKAFDSWQALATLAEAPVFPAAYTVRLIPSKRDCLWRIAAYPFIYNDPFKWKIIYEANKKTFRDPSNPNLIFPGQVLVIPALAGERRAGSYDPATTWAEMQNK